MFKCLNRCVTRTRSLFNIKIRLAILYISPFNKTVTYIAFIRKTLRVKKYSEKSVAENWISEFYYIYYYEKRQVISTATFRSVTSA